MDSGRMSSTTVGGVVRHDANACEGVSENATLILDCWHTAQRFGTVLYHIVSYYRIVSRYFVQYRIVSIVFPHGHIVPSLFMFAVTFPEHAPCIFFCIWKKIKQLDKAGVVFVATGYHTEGICTWSPMLRFGCSTLGCKSCVEISTKRPLQTSLKVAQHIASSVFTVI